MSLQASGGTSSQDVETVLLQLTMWQGRRGSRKQLLPRYCWACGRCCSSIACLTAECSLPYLQSCQSPECTRGGLCVDASRGQVKCPAAHQQVGEH